MSDIKIISDIHVLNREIVFGFEDIELVEGSECLLQDIKTKLYTDIGALFYDPNYGSGILRYIQSNGDELTLLEFKQALKSTLKSDDRIDNNSILVTVKFENDQLKADLKFTADKKEFEMELVL